MRVGEVGGVIEDIPAGWAATVADAVLPVKAIGNFIYGLWVQPATVTAEAR